MATYVICKRTGKTIAMSSGDTAPSNTTTCLCGASTRTSDEATEWGCDVDETVEAIKAQARKKIVEALSESNRAFRDLWDTWDEYDDEGYYQGEGDDPGWSLLIPFTFRSEMDITPAIDALLEQLWQ